MAEFAVEAIAEDGTNATYNAANGGGDSFVNDGKTVLHIKNGSAGPLTVTVPAVASTTEKSGFGTLSKADAAIAVPAGEERFLGKFPVQAFGALASITYSGVTSLTVAVLRI